MRRFMTLVGVLFVLLLPTSAPAWDPDGNTTATVPSDVTDIVSDVFPERSNAGASYISTIYDRNVLVTEDATITVIFVHEGAGYQNTLGWFLWNEDTSGNITVEEANLIWVNASSPGSVVKGDLATLKDENGNDKTFVDGDKVGFFVVADGNRRSDEVDDWDASSPSLP